MPYPTTPTMGVNFSTAYASLNGVEAGKDPPQLGTIIQGSEGSSWMFVQASTSIPANYAVGVDELYKANPLSSTMAAAGYVVGVNGTTAVDANATTGSPYFWLALQWRTGGQVAVASSCAADVALYTTTTPGILDDSATATQTLVEGIVITTTQASTTGLTGASAIVTYPRGR